MPIAPADPPIPPDRPVIPTDLGLVSRIWRWAKYVIGLGLAALAIWAVAGKSDELSGATHFLDHLRWGWAIAAALAEALSYLSFAAMQRRLLAAGDVRIPMPFMTAITVAGNAIQNSLPAGLVLSSAYAFRQFRRWGADEVLSGWVVVAMGAVTMVTLSLLAAVGLSLAASTGSAYDLVGTIIGVAIIAVLVVLAWVQRDFLIGHATTLVRLSQRVLHRPKGDADQLVALTLERMSRVAPTRRQWAWATSFAMGNWLLDMACLALSFTAIGTGVPWDGLLLAYTAAQLATTLPITPGGLGVVEGSLTVALVAFGGGEASTVAAVLLYRLLSYWFMLPIGWGAWGFTSLAGRRRDGRRNASQLAGAGAADA